MEDKIAVRCKNAKEWNEVQEKAFKKGKYWWNGKAKAVKDYGGSKYYIGFDTDGTLMRTQDHDITEYGYTIISAAEYLNEGGKDVSEFKVEITKVKYPSYWYDGKVGERFTVKKGDALNYICTHDDNCLIRIEDCIVVKSTTKTQTTKENNMNTNISNVFDKTKEALLVEKHLGNQIGTSFIDGLVLADKKDDVLKEAKRLEKEEKDK